MIKQTKIILKDGTMKTNVRVMISYRPGPKMPPKQKTIKNFGYLENAQNLEEFWKEVHQLDEDSKKGHENTILISVPIKAKNNATFNKKYNYGYRYLEAVFESLKIKNFFDNISFKGKYSLYDVFSFLVYNRILNPASKRMNYQEINKFYNKDYDFELYDVYRALDIFSDNSVQLQSYVNQRIKEIIGRDQSYAFYDVTNYYFEKDFNGPIGTLPQKGVSKEHQLTPIVQFGLFMDSNNIPIAMKSYPGNTSDSLTLRPAINDLKRDFKLGRLIVVADKGLNSSANIDFITANGDGYVVSQILKGPKGKRFHDIMFDKEGYKGDDDFRYKIFEEEYETNINKNKKVIRRRKVLIYWSKEDAAFAKAKRREKILKAEKNLNNNVYDVDHSKEKYVVKQYFVEKTGEKAEKEVKGINYDRIEDEEKFDGYFCIITSELDYDYKKILEVYHNLSNIEESFKITKSDLQTRPMYVTTDKHIDGHLLICFIALTVLRMIQLKMGTSKISVERLKKVLNCCNLKQINEMVVELDAIEGQYKYKEEIGKNNKTYTSLSLDNKKDQIRLDYLALMKAYDIDIDEAFMYKKDFNKKYKQIKYKLKKVINS